MMKITLIALSSLKEKYLKDAIAEYSKRISRFAKLEITELADEKIPDNASEKQEETVKAKEGDMILSRLKDGYTIALCVEGKQLSSEEMAEYINNAVLSGQSRIVFIIGGSLGLSDEVKKRADFKLSFSKMTFPHRLMKVILLEQIYRAFTIIEGKTYHK